ncbi:MAG TPA: MtrB/PioB family outer membrane beta-barrel protein [Thermodesulfobacteriota bacterium]|nr:MtrB/PioB family outer membrane beta-barrel protein [Thermodesulfobacteriota bacterium]
MKWKNTIFALIVILTPFPDAFSEEVTVEGEVGAEGVYAGVSADEGGRAKFTEYRDLKQGFSVFGNMGLGIDSDTYFLKFRAGDMAYDTQFYELEGGMWGRFKFNLFYDEIPHNITFDARTPFLGAGHDTLVGTPNLNFPAWNTFDYSVLRHQYGGDFKVDVLRPFFLDVSFARENREGIKPTGAAETNPGGIAFELPEPVDYVTNNLKVSAGYAQKPLFLSLNYVHSDFINSNHSLTLPSTFQAPNAFSLPPDNTYDKGAFKGAVSLPFNSRFSTNMGFSRGTSDTSIVSLIGSGYTGRVATQNYDFALTSNPIRFLDAKVYYKYYRRHNESDDPTGVTNIFLNYKISTAGADIGLRLPEDFYLSGGYKYVKTERNKRGETDPAEILPFNVDNIYFVNLKWSGLDFLDVRMGYERFDRDAHYRTLDSAVNPARRFYYAAQNRDTFKAALDIFPLENLNFGLEYKYTSTDYPDTIFGLRGDKRYELDASADYTVGKIVKVYAYGDVGRIKFDQLQFEGTTLLPWEADQWDKTWGYGLGAEVYVIPKKLTLVFKHDYLKSNGAVNFTLNNGLFATGVVGLGPGTGANNDNIDIDRWDDYTLYSLSIRAVYNFTKSLTAMIGYAYERFWYSDAQLNNYQFVNPPGGPVTGTNGAFLTGAYKDQSYKANLVFGGLTYKF